MATKFLSDCADVGKSQRDLQIEAGKIGSVMCSISICPELNGYKLPFILPVTAQLSRFQNLDKTNLLHLTARLAVPLYHYLMEDMPAPYGTGLTIKFGLTDMAENPVLKNFSIRKSQTSQNLRWDSERCPIMLCRVDGKPLDWRIVVAMWCFVESVVKEIEAANRTVVGESGSDYDKFFSKMNPRDFKRYFEMCSDIGWEDLEFPVKLDCCRACGMEEEKLLVCGKCEIVRYCSKECQRDDWDAHKKICTKD